jgi:Spy/CpxP family protein refolding chaperone
MFGFFVGTLCLIALVRVLKFGGRGRRWNGRKWMLHRLFSRLDTTVGQEKVLSKSVEALTRLMDEARHAMELARERTAAILRRETFDTDSLGEAFAKQIEILENFQKTLREELKSIHEALSPDQRQHLSSLLENRYARRHSFSHSYSY